ncbi:MAG: hypothetical protein KBF73_03700 [Flavobacteriales bacterium]|nr:hypothetical protein [Flavobacteriales bacterium]
MERREKEEVILLNRLELKKEPYGSFFYASTVGRSTQLPFAATNNLDHPVSATAFIFTCTLTVPLLLTFL